MVEPWWWFIWVLIYSIYFLDHYFLRDELSHEIFIYIGVYLTLIDRNASRWHSEVCSMLQFCHITKTCSCCLRPFFVHFLASVLTKPLLFRFVTYTQKTIRQSENMLLNIHNDITVHIRKMEDYTYKQIIYTVFYSVVSFWKIYWWNSDLVA